MNEKHLEFIQGVINRHNSNSFRIKGWAITITSAIFALTGTIKEPYLCFIALGPIVMFWILDSMFLANERCFVSLYNCVTKGSKISIEKKNLTKRIRKKLEEDIKEYTVTDYSMNFVQFREIKKNNWWSVLFSYTIRWFYLALVILTFATYFGLNEFIKVDEQKPININATITSTDSLKISPIEIKTIVTLTDTIQINQIENKVVNPKDKSIKKE